MDRDSKVLILHHNDLDGYGCAVMLRAFFKNSKSYPASFDADIDKKLESIEYDKYDHVFVVDIHPTSEKYLDMSDKIILIDHHPSTYGNPKKNRFVVTKGKCATYLVWHYLKKTFPQYKFDMYKNFVYDVNEFDMWTNKSPKGKCLNELLYGPYPKELFIERFKKGNTRFSKDEMAFIKGRRDTFKEIYDTMEVFVLERTKSCMVMCEDFVNDISHKLLHEEGFDLVFIKQGKKDRVSIRQKLDSVNIGKILDDLGYGGGHEKAAGFYENDPNKIKEKILRIEDELLKCLA